MRFISLFLFLLNVQYYSVGQNLVPDPGFEIKTIECIVSPPLVHWFNPNIATPDLYSLDPCGTQLTPENMNLVGAPLPYEGQSYVGMFCCEHPESASQTREYVSTQLIESLQSGQIYTLRFKLARAIVFDLAIDKIGAYFSTDAPWSESPNVMDVEPQVETSGEVLTPDLEWMTIEFEFTAQGGEQFLTLGNFRYPDEMTVVFTGLSWKNFFSAYYLFDDVHLELKETSTHSISIIESSWFINSDGVLYAETSGEYKIYSLSGIALRSGNFNSGTQSLPLSDLAAGVYIIYLQNSTEQRTFKFFKK